MASDKTDSYCYAPFDSVERKSIVNYYKNRHMLRYAIKVYLRKHVVLGAMHGSLFKLPFPHATYTARLTSGYRLRGSEEKEERITHANDSH